MSSLQKFTEHPEWGSRADNKTRSLVLLIALINIRSSFQVVVVGVGNGDWEITSKHTDRQTDRRVINAAQTEIYHHRCQLNLQEPLDSNRPPRHGRVYLYLYIFHLHTHTHARFGSTQVFGNVGRGREESAWEKKPIFTRQIKVI